MFGSNRWNAVQDIFDFHRNVDRFFNQFWNDLQASSNNATSAYTFQVQTEPDQWRVMVPMAGIDPKLVQIEVAANTISIRAEQNGGSRDGEVHFSQTITVPQFLDLDKISANHRHGMLELTVPLRDSVKPRRIEISGVHTAGTPQKQLTTS
jgi:HSP20 family protein